MLKWNNKRKLRNEDEVITHRNKDYWNLDTTYTYLQYSCIDDIPKTQGDSLIFVLILKLLTLIGGTQDGTWKLIPKIRKNWFYCSCRQWFLVCKTVILWNTCFLKTILSQYQPEFVINPSLNKCIAFKVTANLQFVVPKKVSDFSVPVFEILGNVGIWTFLTITESGSKHFNGSFFYYLHINRHQEIQ